MFNKKKKAPVTKEMQKDADLINECAEDYRDKDQSYALRLYKLQGSLEGFVEGYEQANAKLGINENPLIRATLNMNKAQQEFVQELIDHFEELSPALDYANRENEV